MWKSAQTLSPVETPCSQGLERQFLPLLCVKLGSPFLRFWKMPQFLEHCPLLLTWKSPSKGGGGRAWRKWNAGGSIVWCPCSCRVLASAVLRHMPHCLLRRRPMQHWAITSVERCAGIEITKPILVWLLNRQRAGHHSFSSPHEPWRSIILLFPICRERIEIRKTEVTGISPFGPCTVSFQS